MVIIPGIVIPSIHRLFAPNNFDVVLLGVAGHEADASLLVVYSHGGGDGSTIFRRYLFIYFANSFFILILNLIGKGMEVEIRLKMVSTYRNFWR